jgi:hypothetical protein
MGLRHCRKEGGNSRIKQPKTTNMLFLSVFARHFSGRFAVTSVSRLSYPGTRRAMPPPGFPHVRDEQPRQQIVRCANQFEHGVPSHRRNGAENQLVA